MVSQEPGWVERCLPRFLRGRGGAEQGLPTGVTNSNVQEREERRSGAERRVAEVGGEAVRFVVVVPFSCNGEPFWNGFTTEGT